MNYHANRLDGLEHTWRSVIQCEDLFTRDAAVVTPVCTLSGQTMLGIQPSQNWTDLN